MNFTTFIRRNAFRNKRRTALTVLSIAFSLFLLILVNALLDFFNNPDGPKQAALRLVVQRTTAFVDGMPIAYMSRLEKIKNVTLVAPVQFYAAYYRDTKNIFPMLAIDPEKVFDVFTEHHVPPEQYETFKTSRRGAIVGEVLAQRFDWKIGDNVTLIGQMPPVDAEFIITGIYKSDSALNADAFYFHYDYYNEFTDVPNTVAFIWLVAANAESMPQIIEDADALFRNTPAETKTQSEKAFFLSFLSMLGNIKALMASIASVVVFTMLIVVGSTIAMTIRERFREVGILKAIGYTRRTVLFLIIGEAIFIAVCGGALGALMAYCIRYADLRALTAGMIPALPIRPQIYVAAIAIAAGIGLVSSMIPALRASGLTITQAMRRVE